MQIHVTLSATHPLPPDFDAVALRSHLLSWYPDANVSVERRGAAARVVVGVDLEPGDPRPAVFVAEHVRSRVLDLMLAHWEAAHG